MAIKSRRIGEQVESNTLGRIRVQNNGAAIKAGDILSVVGTNTSAGFLKVEIADANAAPPLSTGMKLVAAHDIAAGSASTGIAVSWKIVTKVDTTAFPGGAAAPHAPLYLSDLGTAGNTVDTAASAGPYTRIVGQVLTLSSGAGIADGVILLAPAAWIS